MSQIAALELAADNIRVNVINPGAILTPMVHSNTLTPVSDAELGARLAGLQPLKRTGLPIDIAEAALWLASDQARFVTGQVLGVDGGGVVNAGPGMEKMNATKGRR